MEEVSGNLLSYAGEFEGVTHKKWIGTKMLSYRLLREQHLLLGELRFPERKEIGIRVEDGGWHFGYMGGHGEKDIRKRVQEKSFQRHIRSIIPDMYCPMWQTRLRMERIYLGAMRSLSDVRLTRLFRAISENIKRAWISEISEIGQAGHCLLPRS